MKKYLTTIIIAVVVGVMAFFGGYKFGSVGSSKVSGVPGGNQFAGRAEMMRQGGQAGSRNGQNIVSGMVNGKVLSKDATSLVVQLGGTNAGSKIVLYSTSTAVRETVASTVDKLQIGDSVSIRGAQNSDGSVAAISIQLLPAGTGTSTFGF